MSAVQLVQVAPLSSRHRGVRQASSKLRVNRLTSNKKNMGVHKCWLCLLIAQYQGKSVVPLCKQRGETGVRFIWTMLVQFP